MAGDIANGVGRSNMGNNNMFVINRGKYLFWGNMGLPRGIHCCQPAQDAGLDGLFDSFINHFASF
jgi:hypothetical protein